MSKTNDVIFEALLKQHELWLGKGNTKRAHHALRDLLVHLHGVATKAASCDGCACKTDKDAAKAEVAQDAPERKVYAVEVGDLSREQVASIIENMKPEQIKQAVEEVVTTADKPKPRKK